MQNRGANAPQGQVIIRPLSGLSGSLRAELFAALISAFHPLSTAVHRWEHSLYTVLNVTKVLGLRCQ